MKVRTGFRIATAVVVMLVVFGAFWLFSGRYNVAADEPHWAITEWFLETVREQSINARLGEIDVPDLSGAERVAEGARHYDAMCVHCHLKPGQTNTEIRQGLNPTPPNLARHAVEPAEAFWVAKHGIRMTGMPAWGETHSDRELWSVVAFLQQLSDLTADEYARMTATKAPAEHAHEHEADAAHSRRH